ncbi:uncharacterized protein LOC130663229 [Microplitis mediator]|uniref:uncharacterized protein LOC130663229 n=1 Tax=Microplitis mediator TaxID=375433 RepID=UPI002556C17F|nr:uncharacterized protein LOC130663229 [Microplitis mediator]
MNHSITWLVGAILIASNLFAYTIAAVVPENEEALKTVSNGINHFASNFYKTSSDGESDNLICSPLSANIVLSMASYGAGGNTQQQMRSTLHIPENDEVGKRGFQSLIDNLNSLKKVELKLAQKIFMQNGIEIKHDFKDITENYFRSTAQTLDFGKAEEASQTINNWCSEKTNNRIKEVIKADDVKEASIVLVNAVYFKGNWNSPFKGYNTSPRPFHVDESTTKDVDMMYQERSFNYGALPDLDAIFVELPYESENENDATSMFIILPNTITGLKKLEESLYKINFKELHDNEHRTLMHLEMPKFKIESTLQLQPILEKLGMTDMFQDTADFKGITDDPPLKISKVVQKAFIEVNEKGSEAAAVTAMVAVPMSLPMYPVKPIRVNVDRPFAYVLHHIATNTILFQGHIKLPKMNQIQWLIGAILITSSFSNLIVAADAENEEALRAVSNGMNQFSTEFYKTSSVSAKDNLICSPLSAGIVLSMTAFGARGNTEKQMRSSLRMPEDDAVGKRGFQALIDNLNNVKKVELKLAQKVFTASGFELKPDFKDITENYFRSAAQDLDFTKSEEAAKIINTWCEEHTNNRIKDVIQPSDLDQAALVLINAVYFKGNWYWKFNPESTKPKPFHVDDKTTKDVDMMHQKNSFNYGSLPELDAIYVELPYEREDENDATSMFIILPNQINGLEKAEESLGKVNFKELHDNRRKTEMNLYMPKFRTESTLQLQTILENMGMTDMFQNAADFTGIADSPPLKVSKVIQKAFIEVNEEGSEAAAVTAIIVMGASSMFDYPEPITVEINHPFLYVLHHNPRNIALFQGHVKLPSMS